MPHAPAISCCPKSDSRRRSQLAVIDVTVGPYYKWKSMSQEGQNHVQKEVILTHGKYKGSKTEEMINALLSELKEQPTTYKPFAVMKLTTYMKRLRVLSEGM